MAKVSPLFAFVLAVDEINVVSLKGIEVFLYGFCLI